MSFDLDPSAVLFTDILDLPSALFITLIKIMKVCSILWQECSFPLFYVSRQLYYITDLLSMDCTFWLSEAPLTCATPALHRHILYLFELGCFQN